MAYTAGGKHKYARKILRAKIARGVQFFGKFAFDEFVPSNMDPRNTPNIPVSFCGSLRSVARK